MKPKRKNKPGAGRPNEGRKRVEIHMLPAAIKDLDSRVQKGGKTRGRVVEKLLEETK